MLDINNTLDLIKLKFYNEWLYTSHLYDEGESDLHQQLTHDMVEKYVEPLNLKKDANILDIGCGYGYFLEEMKEREYTNVTGITLSEGNANIINSKGLVAKVYDPTFLPQADGYDDESVDFIFLRHSLQHSPYPIFSLTEYNRLLKQFSKMYIEVPAPGGDRRHEYNQNHYSIFGPAQLEALLVRTGFKIDSFNNMEFELSTKNPEGEEVKVKEQYYCILVTKQRPLDIK
jgi:SAM-dependent methyltransferase